jgi:hypothetical protein
MLPLKAQQVQQVLGTGLVRRSIAVIGCRVVVVVAAQCQNSPHSRILFRGCTEQEEVAVIRGI